MASEIKKTNHNRIYALLVAIIVVLVAVSAYFIFYKGKQDAVVIDELTIQKEILARDFQELALDYDTLQTNNDTIFELLSHEREKIAQLLEEIKTIKSANSAKIAEYKKELSSLRGVMKSFVVQIDSLNARNQILTQENKEVRNNYVKIKDSYKVLEEEKKGLAQKVEIASQLEARNFEAMALNSKGKETNRMSRASKIKICFTIGKNLTAPVGEKSVYLRLSRPDNELLLKSKDDLFEYEGSMINYSAVRVIEYGGEAVDVCIYYEVEEGELMEGSYTADIFADNSTIGQVTFELK